MLADTVAVLKVGIAVAVLEVATLEVVALEMVALEMTVLGMGGGGESAGHWAPHWHHPEEAHALATPETAATG